WGRVALRDLRLGGGEDQPLVALKSMVIAFERPSAFSREVILTDMVIEGGQIEGSVAQFRRVATSVRGPSEETDETPEETRDASSKAALPRWVPRLLSVSDVSFRI